MVNVGVRPTRVLISLASSTPKSAKHVDGSTDILSRARHSPPSICYSGLSTYLSSRVNEIIVYLLFRFNFYAFAIAYYINATKLRENNRDKDRSDSFIFIFAESEIRNKFQLIFNKLETYVKTNINTLDETIIILYR